MSRADAEHFATFEEGMEDYMPDELDLCYPCTKLLFERNWTELHRRSR